MLHSIRHIENRNKGYKDLESTLNIFGLASGCTHILYISKIFSRGLRAYWMTIISYLTLGKLIPTHFIVPYTLLNIFGSRRIKRSRSIALLLVGNIQ